MAKPTAMILRAPGTNCEEETAEAWQLAGALVEVWHIGRLLEAPASLDRFQILTIPGGFSYGDDLGAGRILATRLGAVLGEALRRFRDRGGLVLGICNGFQVLVRAGLLPGGKPAVAATLAQNDCGHFESRWVRLLPRPGVSPFVNFDRPIELPIAHGEGKLVLAEGGRLTALERAGQIVLQYADAAGRPTQEYPGNPNGSQLAVAGLCDETGRVFGLMPHPERFVTGFHHPQWTSRDVDPESVGDGMQIFLGAIESLRS